MLYQPGPPQKTKQSDIPRICYALMVVTSGDSPCTHKPVWAWNFPITFTCIHIQRPDWQNPWECKQMLKQTNSLQKHDGSRSSCVKIPVGAGMRAIPFMTSVASSDRYKEVALHMASWNAEVHKDVAYRSSSCQARLVSCCLAKCCPCPAKLRSHHAQPHSLQVEGSKTVQATKRFDIVCTPCSAAITTK